MNLFFAESAWRWSLGRWVGEQFIAEGERMPWWLGVAWWCPYSSRAYCLPVPLNKVVGSFRNWWIAVRRPAEDDPIADAYQFGHSKGYVDGRRDGERHGLVLREIVERALHATADDGNQPQSEAAVAKG